MRRPGKTVRGKTYLHRSAVSHRDDLAPLVHSAQNLAEGWDWDVARVDPQGMEVALIVSLDFDTAPEPTVGDMLVVNLVTTKTVHRPERGFIYHHKHLFVPDDYRGFDLDRSRARSEAWEELGVDKSRIGRRAYWASEVEPLIRNGIDPSKTAISRNSLSKPIRELLDTSLMDDVSTVLDFGSGKGGDTSRLLERGYDTTAYDPGFGDVAPRGRFDAVLMVYVLNTIHGPIRRAKAMKQAWNRVAPGGFLFVATRTPAEVDRSVSDGSHEPCHDGWCSTRDTFQRGVSTDDLVKMAGRLTNAVAEGTLGEGTLVVRKR